jgi:aryl-phospho-beta-D-glucosidase BglC (GH1 family)
MSAHILDRYKAGINLGGWISQCKYQPEHIASFISEADISRIASWGMDHVRLPVDYPVIEDSPFECHGAGFAVIDKLIGWCNKYKLNVVLDMHKAPGYSFADNNLGDQGEVKLFTDSEIQKRYIFLWEAFARRYTGERENVAFEILNEITNPHGESWNRLARKAIEAIQAIDPHRYIVLGGPYFNSVTGLDTLEIWDDEHILYTFHYYLPFEFTHQRASWTRLKDSGIHLSYPDPAFNKEYLREQLVPALDFMKKTGKRLYCGEYGVIELADMDSRVNWLRDISELFAEYQIGRAYWTYKGMDFSSVDENGSPVSRELIEAISW